MNDINNLFFELIRVAIGNQVCLSRTPKINEWQELYAMAKKQSLVGICFAGVQKLQTQRQAPNSWGNEQGELLYLQWMGMAAKIQQRNETLNKQCAELQLRFASEGFRTCVLKGQGNALLYNENLRALRQSGDIDLWVEGSRDDIIRYINTIGVETGSIDIKHWPVHFFKDTEVEIHFRPSWFYNPIHDRRFMDRVKISKDAQFSSQAVNGIVSPTIAFNLVYILIHIYRHLFDEGIGLRQLLDYYFVLKASTDTERKEAFETARDFGLKHFTTAVMYVLQEVCALEKELMLCAPSYKYGIQLLEVVMIGGNFGKYDTRYGVHRTGRMRRGLESMERNINFIFSYPSEVFWLPIWKVWHLCWRMNKYSV